MAASLELVAESVALVLLQIACPQDAGIVDQAGQWARRSLALPQEPIAADTQIQAEMH